jgi:hypothetical protein
VRSEFLSSFTIWITENTISSLCNELEIRRTPVPALEKIKIKDSERDIISG